jgi:hypothetical protein
VTIAAAHSTSVTRLVIVDLPARNQAMFPM